MGAASAGEWQDKEQELVVTGVSYRLCHSAVTAT